MYISKLLPRRSVVKNDRREEREELADIVRGRRARVHRLALRKREGNRGEQREGERVEERRDEEEKRKVQRWKYIVNYRKRTNLGWKVKIDLFHLHVIADIRLHKYVQISIKHPQVSSEIKNSLQGV